MDGLPSYETIGRLSRYRRLLTERVKTGNTSVYSHELAAVAGVSAAQVRRDMMSIGANGSSTRGYDVEKLIECLGTELDAPEGRRAALVGVGNLGRAMLSFFQGRRPKLTIEAVFDNKPDRVGRVICGCRCYPMEELPQVIAEKKITIGIIAVPSVVAQAVAADLEDAGVRGILNFAPVALRVGPETFFEDIDMTMALERVSYFAGRNS
ncbi:MAG: redox-sensing transcriptional repressor Rex [bacterium]|nr:redox-sensing transcriptional repressor Rex [bacterium]